MVITLTPEVHRERVPRRRVNAVKTPDLKVRVVSSPDVAKWMAERRSCTHSSWRSRFRPMLVKPRRWTSPRRRILVVKRDLVRHHGNPLIQQKIRISIRRGYAQSWTRCRKPVARNESFMTQCSLGKQREIQEPSRRWDEEEASFPTTRRDGKPLTHHRRCSRAGPAFHERSIYPIVGFRGGVRPRCAAAAGGDVARARFFR